MCVCVNNTYPNGNPNPEKYTHTFKKKERNKKEREKKRAKEERDSKRASAREIKESRAPRTSCLASTFEPACSSASTVSLCPFCAERKRGVAPSCCIGGIRGESCRGGQGAHTRMHTHGCVPGLGCVCVKQYMHLQARIPRYVHTVYTCVYTHTHVYIYIHKYVFKTQTLNSGTAEFSF
jgi:hypothetical protein